MLYNFKLDSRIYISTEELYIVSFLEHSENFCFYINNELPLAYLNKKKSVPEDSIIQLRTKGKLYISYLISFIHSIYHSFSEGLLAASMCQ